ncbi:O-methyltransferase, partial [Bacillus litorisediminis]|uniref:O-methyltransferase n=1 Tax=Bacillus litorisediminis TaxID=2922713 RepID=UPI001FAD521F
NINLTNLNTCLVKKINQSKIADNLIISGIMSKFIKDFATDSGSLEYNPKHANVAQTNLERAGLSDKVQILTGPALDSLPKLQSMGYDAFDFIFIDADKPNNPNYLKWALQLSRVGTVIVGDNVVRDGEVVNQNSQNPSVIGTRQFFDLLANEPRIEATAIQTVGNKGYDGFAIGVVVGN